MVWPGVPSARLGGIALDTLYALAGAVEGGVVLDAIWLSTRDRAFLDAGRARMDDPRLVEVWCDVPEELARRRFEQRLPDRHEMHEAWRPGYWEGAGPITEDPIRVNTTVIVDVAALASVVRARLEG